ncbi:MAG TPA: leucyl aminopeptidase [Bryobacteraceae bacterium]|nr:leucyl aminopeptidase [Bryobacteraceae bacterium]
METNLLVQPFDRVGADAIAIVLFEDEPAPAELQSATAWLDELRSSGEFTGKPAEIAVAHLPQGLAAKRLVVAGGGKRDKFDAAALRRAVGSTVRTLKQKGVKKLAWWLGAGSPADAEAAVEGAILGNYETDRYKPSSEAKPLDSFVVAAVRGGADLEAAVTRARIIGEAQNFTRDLANEPANRLTPTILADRARAMAAEQGLECEVLDQDRMRQLGMGSLLGVAQGSAEPPALIIVRYRPAKEPATKDHLGLVGKGVTFDTGGISIKPAEGMEKMKYDMCGGAAVLGAMRAIAQLKPAIPVTALVPAVENMPGSKAQRPGDIVTSLSGKTVEVLNTDAEGRLILNDALTYSQRLGCTHLVDAATLTGAIVVALGYVNVGAFTNNDALLGRVLGAAKQEGEKMWHMPLDEDYKELLKSPFADLANIGGRWGGAISAAWFLREFVDDTPWVHLDIAGTAWLEENKPFMAKGPTGVCVRTFVNLAMNW